MKNLFSLLLLLILSLLLYSCTGQENNTKVMLKSPAEHHSELPFLFTDNSGALFLSWVQTDPGSDMYELKYSKWNGTEWSESSRITSSDSWFVNWADYPSIVGYSGNAVAAHVLKKIPGNTYSYNVNMVLNNEDGWAKPFAPHNDSTATEHGFASMVALNDSEILAAWLDGRRTEDRKDDEYFDLNKAMTLRSAVINETGEISDRKLLDDSVCDCCQTSMTMTEQGPFIAYRNRTSEEIRDIYYSRYSSGEWTNPKPVYNDNWKIGACPVNGPRVASRDSLIAISWYTGAEDTDRVKIALSTDYGASFNEPIVVNESGTSGRVDVAIGDTGNLYVSELVKKGDSYYLNLNEVDYRNGTVSSRTVTEMNGSRRSGFPQMELVKDKLFFAWTEISNDTLTQVKTISYGL